MADKGQRVKDQRRHEHPTQERPTQQRVELFTAEMGKGAHLNGSQIQVTQQEIISQSVLGFDIGNQIIQAVQCGILQKGGGHKMAGGFTLKKENIPIFRDFLIKNFEKSNINSSVSTNLYLDSIIAPSALNEVFFDEINCLAPFGSGNSEPKFVIENIKVISANIVGNNHIKLVLSGKDGTVFKSLAWNAIDTPLEPFLNNKNRKRINIAGKIHLNQWRGERKVEFIIEDIALN